MFQSPGSGSGFSSGMVGIRYEQKGQAWSRRDGRTRDDAECSQELGRGGRGGVGVAGQGLNEVKLWSLGRKLLRLLYSVSRA